MSVPIVKPELIASGVTHVPVKMAAHDWKVTARRIRYLLNWGRLEGLRLANGSWLVSPLPLPVHFWRPWACFKA
jgi:hypothetical protein